MPDNDRGSASFVVALAHRLRMIQTDFADDAPEVREAYVADELEHALRAVPPDERPEILQQLSEHFPSWDRQVSVDAEAGRPGGESAVDERELSDASFLVTRLIEVAGDLSDRQRQVIRDRLIAAGLAEAEPGVTWRGDAAVALREVLALSDDAEVDPQRALATVDLLVTCLVQLDKLAGRTWRDIAPRERIKEAGKLPHDLGRFLSGDEDVSREQLAEDLDRLRRMVASMILAIKNAPRTWSLRHLEKFSVPAIEAVVNVEGVGLLGNRDAKCWEKYRQLVADLDETVMAQDILEVVAVFAGKAFGGSGES